jgi:putative hemolysin
MGHSALFIATVGLCIGLSFLFSGMEAGVFALNRLRIRQQMRAGRRRAALLHGYLENLENFLWTILIGNTLATFTALSLIISVLYQFLGKHRVLFLLAFLILAFLFYVFCDLLPKMLFRLYPTRLCLIVAGPFRFIHLGLSPLVSLLAWLSHRLLRWTAGPSYKSYLFGNRSELRQVMQESAQNLTSEERTMINRVFELQNLTVSSMAIPLGKVIGVMAHSPVQEVLELCRQHQLTRLPVWSGAGPARKIAGIVSLTSVLYSPDFDPAKPASACVKPALYLREDLRLEEALRRMQRSGHRLAIVLGLDQRELGILSLQDILKSIFGEVTL